MSLRTLLRAALVPVAAIAALATTPAASADPVTPYIVGGGNATETYSFMGSIQLNGRHGCGASLISAQWMVTAGHCTYNQQTPIQPSQVRVRIGSTQWSSGGTLAGVSQIVRHPNYRPGGGQQYDIALLRLSSSVSQAPIGLGDTSPAANTGVRLIGWGQTCNTPQCGQPPVNLKQLDTRINPDGMCTNEFNAGHELCVYSTTTQTACYGDSGGPMVQKVGAEWRLLGATSRAGVNNQTCGAGQATIYTDVVAFKQWIQSTTGGGGGNPPGCSVAEWSPSEYYPPGSSVAYQSSVWRNPYWSYGEAPGQGYAWQRVGQC
ncbi:serine protease [Actinosynnema sp. NPDC050436]|uniref:S1 family peptidase n=1 Tax=Actinosynnema sp. NPDC050436 TaxID=3155659 RepID=UPI0033E45EAD